MTRRRHDYWTRSPTGRRRFAASISETFAPIHPAI
jgi:hypothetical protein